MGSAYRKDIRRSIWRGKKRFFSIALIAALGVTMLTGLRAACDDLRMSADRFFDAQNLFDVSVVSTHGLTDEDIAALGALEGISLAEGGFTARVYTQVGGRRQTADVKTLSRIGISVPHLIEGRLPAGTDEVAVTAEYLTDSGLSIGDRLTIEEDLKKETDEDEEFSVSLESNDPSFDRTAFTITGIVIDPTDINSPSGAVAFRSTAAADYIFFVTDGCVVSDVYTAVYLTLDGAADLLCFSEEYEKLVAAQVAVIEGAIKQQREQARYDAIVVEATDKLTDAAQEMRDEFADIDAEFADALAKLEDARRELRNGQRELLDQEKAANEGFADARKQIADGLAAITSGRAALVTNEATVAQGERDLAAGQTALDQNRDAANAGFAAAQRQLDDAKTQTEAGRDLLLINKSQIEGMLAGAWPAAAWDTLVAAAKTAHQPVYQLWADVAGLQATLATLTPGTADYNAAQQQITTLSGQATQAEAAAPGLYADERSALHAAVSGTLTGLQQQLQTQLAGLTPGTEAYNTVQAQLAALAAVNAGDVCDMAVGLGQADASLAVTAGQQTALNAQIAGANAQFAAAQKTIDDNAKVLAEARAQLNAGKAKLDAGYNELIAGERELAKQEREAREKLADGKQELANGREELADGEREYQENLTEYEQERADAERKLADAWQELRALDMTQWYVQDRGSLSGYMNIQSDADAIESIGTAFPILFFVVAILISLTTITRMVEEDRGLIGTYKALGFTDGEVRRKYFIYAFAACALGGVVGDILGFIALPEIVFTIFGIMYVLPAYYLGFNVLYGVGGAALFVAGIAGAAMLACRNELRQMPATLMRPKAPRAGSRVFLERVASVWNRMSFLNKVTARNLFRYKKRLFMTVFGIMGCTALVLCGFAIRDSVIDLMPRQYEQVYQYDMMAVTSADDNALLLDRLTGDSDVQSILNVQVETIKLKNLSGTEEKVQMIIVPTGASLNGYINLFDGEFNAVPLGNDGIYVTRNAAHVLGFDEGDTVAVQNLKLEQAEVKCAALVENYLGNTVYMTQAVYESLFGEMQPNGVLVNLSATCTDQPAFAEALGRQDEILTCISTEELKGDFSTAFTMINMVVYIIIIMAAGLALVVLFTLATTNISERDRELATIKVLGFFDPEVHLYVNKETLILTSLGILLGLPVGRALGGALTSVLDMPSIYFAVTVQPFSYLLAAVVSFGFALLVNLITDRVLDHIDPVEALKSVE